MTSFCLWHLQKIVITKNPKFLSATFDFFKNFANKLCQDINHTSRICLAKTLNTMYVAKSTLIYPYSLEV